MVELERLTDMVDLKGEVISEHHHCQFFQRAVPHPRIRPLSDSGQQVMDVLPFFDRPYLRPFA
ncbi:hypothetical protein [Streptomyces sp. NPDC008001]|uniref:hypothetical protein n=1 Tax=Streptomyces sp. NPDC008001 TaxID=3364804 RepID=UPI0036DFB1B2